MTNSILMDIADQYFKEVNKGLFEWNFLGFQYNGYIKQRKIRNARRIFAPYDENEEEPLLIVDSTILKSGKRGVFVTNNAVYYKLASINGKGMTQGRLTWEEIEEIYFQPKMTGSFFIINGNRIGQFGRFTKGVKADVKECDVLNELFRLWTKELNKKE